MMTRERIWTCDGVTITYRTYNTQFNLIVADTMTAAFRIPTPTKENPGMHSIPAAVQMFYQGMPSIVKVEYETGAAIWGEVLKEEFENPSFLEDPVSDYKRLLRIAPSDLLIKVEEGYMATRDKTYLAPDPLRDDPPDNPALDLEARAREEGPQDESHPITNGGGSSKRKSLTESGSSSRGARKGK